MKNTIRSAVKYAQGRERSQACIPSVCSRKDLHNRWVLSPEWKNDGWWEWWTDSAIWSECEGCWLYRMRLTQWIGKLIPKRLIDLCKFIQKISTRIDVPSLASNMGAYAYRLLPEAFKERSHAILSQSRLLIVEIFKLRQTSYVFVSVCWFVPLRIELLKVLQTNFYEVLSGSKTI